MQKWKNAKMPCLLYALQSQVQTRKLNEVGEALHLDKAEALVLTTPQRAISDYYFFKLLLYS